MLSIVMVSTEALDVAEAMVDLFEKRHWPNGAYIQPSDIMQILWRVGYYGEERPKLVRAILNNSLVFSSIVRYGYKAMDLYRGTPKIREWINEERARVSSSSAGPIIVSG